MTMIYILDYTITLDNDTMCRLYSFINQSYFWFRNTSSKNSISVFNDAPII